MMDDQQILQLARADIISLFNLYLVHDGEMDDNYDKVKNGINIKCHINFIDYNDPNNTRYQIKPKKGLLRNNVTGKVHSFEEIEDEKNGRIALMLRLILEEDEPIAKTYDVGQLDGNYQQT